MKSINHRLKSVNGYKLITLTKRGKLTGVFIGGTKSPLNPSEYAAPFTLKVNEAVVLITDNTFKDFEKLLDI